jgi:hypothetical protein
MRDNATISTNSPDPKDHSGRPWIYLTTRTGTTAHFKDAGSLADWLAARPGFPHQDIYDRFLEALDAHGAGRRPTGGTVDDALALVASFGGRR